MKNTARKASIQSSAFRRQHAVVHVSAIMHILPGYRGTYIRGVCTFGALQPTANFSQNEGVLIFGGVLIYGVLRYFLLIRFSLVYLTISSIFSATIKGTNLLLKKILSQPIRTTLLFFFILSFKKKRKKKIHGLLQRYLHLKYIDDFLFMRLLTRLQHCLVSPSCVPDRGCSVNVIFSSLCVFLFVLSCMCPEKLVYKKEKKKNTHWR